jgi:hypothetical protein
MRNSSRKALPLAMASARCLTNSARSSGWTNSRTFSRVGAKLPGSTPNRSNVSGDHQSSLGADVELERAHPAGAQGQTQALALDAQLLLRLLGLGDVGHDADQALRLAIGIPGGHQAAAGQPDRRSVGADDPVVGREGVLLLGELAVVLGQVPVLRMQRGDVLVVVSAEPAAPVDEVEAEQRHSFLRPDAGAGRIVGLPRPHAAGLQRRPEARLALAQGVERLRLQRHVRAEDEDARDRAGRVLDGLIDEVEEALFLRPVGRRLDFVLRAVRAVRLAGREHVVEQRDIALARRFGQRVGDGLADHRPWTDELEVGGLAISKRCSGLAASAMKIGACSNSRARRSRSAPSWRAARTCCVVLAADDEDAADPARRGFIVDRAVAVGPVDVLDAAVAA